MKNLQLNCKQQRSNKMKDVKEIPFKEVKEKNSQIVFEMMQAILDTISASTHPIDEVFDNIEDYIEEVISSDHFAPLLDLPKEPDLRREYINALKLFVFTGINLKYSIYELEQYLEFDKPHDKFHDMRTVHLAKLKEIQPILDRLSFLRILRFMCDDINQKQEK